MILPPPPPSCLGWELRSGEVQRLSWVLLVAQDRGWGVGVICTMLLRLEFWAHSTLFFFTCLLGEGTL